MTRYDRLTEAVEWFGIDEDPEAADVDVSHVNAEDCPQWLSITDSSSSECRYGQLHNSYSEAHGRAIDYCGDSISGEYPIAIVNLDTGEKLYPGWTQLPFYPANGHSVDDALTAVEEAS